MEESMATQPILLPEESPWTEEPGRLQSMGSQRVRHDWVTNVFTFTSVKKLPKPLSRISQSILILVLVFKHLELSWNIYHEKNLPLIPEETQHVPNASWLVLWKDHLPKREHGWPQREELSSLPNNRGRRGLVRVVFRKLINPDTNTCSRRTLRSHLSLGMCIWFCFFVFVLLSETKREGS